MGKKSKKKSRSLVERADVAAIEALKPLLESRAGRMLGVVGELGDEPPLTALSGGLLGAGWLRDDPRMTRAGLRMLAAHLAAIGAKTAGKDTIDRTRPERLLKGGKKGKKGKRYRMEAGGSKRSELRSFPSGHAAGAVAVARAFGREYGEHRGQAMGAAAAIGALQIVRRAHFPSDVVAGTALGLGAEAVTGAALDRLLAGARG